MELAPEPSLADGSDASEPNLPGIKVPEPDTPGINVPGSGEAETDATRSGSARSSQRWRLDLSYDGAPFRGFARNRGVRTVAGDLGEALERILSHDVELTVAGRTDAGVHAIGQVVTFDSDAVVDPLRLRSSLNSMLAPSIAVSQVSPVSSDFDARFSARWRRYRYVVLASPVPDPFLAPRSWWIDTSLDLAAMDDAARDLIGEHDFSSFCRRPRTPEPVSLVRRVISAGWNVPGTDPRLRHFEITATAFCHQMVRAITGALVTVGTGRRPASSIAEALARRTRDGMATLAPPQGLYLMAVGYDEAPLA